MQREEESRKIETAAAVQDEATVNSSTVPSDEALKAFNHQITSVLERISDGFVALDTSWRFTYLNRKGEELFRRLQQSKDNLLGKVLWEEFPEILGTEIEKNYRFANQIR